MKKNIIIFIMLFAAMAVADAQSAPDSLIKKNKNFGKYENNLYKYTDETNETKFFYKYNILPKYGKLQMEVQYEHDFSNWDNSDAMQKIVPQNRKYDGKYDIRLCMIKNEGTRLGKCIDVNPLQPCYEDLSGDCYYAISYRVYDDYFVETTVKGYEDNKIFATDISYYIPDAAGNLKKIEKKDIPANKKRKLLISDETMSDYKETMSDDFPLFFTDRPLQTEEEGNK